MAKSIQVKNDGQTVIYNNAKTIVTNDGNRWVPEDETILEELNITSNGDYTPSLYGYSKVTVNVDTSPSTAEKTITQNGTYIAEDDGVDCYSKVTVNVGGTDAPVRIFLDGGETATFTQGTPISYMGIKVMAEMSDGSIVDITDQCEFTPEEGDYVPDDETLKVTITYNSGGSV